MTYEGRTVLVKSGALPINKAISAKRTRIVLGNENT